MEKLRLIHPVDSYKMCASPLLFLRFCSLLEAIMHQAGLLYHFSFIDCTLPNFPVLEPAALEAQFEGCAGVCAGAEWGAHGVGAAGRKRGNVGQGGGVPDKVIYELRNTK